MTDDVLPPVELLRHSAFVRRLAFHLLRDDVEADDAAQETLTRALTSPPRPGPGVRAWLAAVLRNVVRMRGRSAARRQRRESTVARPEAVRAADEAMATAEILRLVADAVRGLDPAHREVVMARH
jgi:RNA polymerase sigma factor (sigma-70 family)